MQYVKAKHEYAENSNKIKQSLFLHKNQLISDNDYMAEKNTYYSAELSMMQAKEVLANFMQQNNQNALNYNDLTLQNMTKLTQVLHDLNRQQEVRVKAPTSGLILLPFKDISSGEINPIARGSSIKQGDTLATIGEVNGLSIHIQVNEFDIGEIKLGQKVKITGVAFPDFVLNGEISNIVHQGQSNTNGMRFFPVEIKIPQLTQQQKSIINIGMSAKVEIEISNTPKISIPINAVVQKDGANYVHLFNTKTDSYRDVIVKLGKATVDSIIIESALKEGDKIVTID